MIPGISQDGVAWLRLRTHLTARIEALRTNLESADTLEKMKKTQGRIAELRELIEAVEGRPDGIPDPDPAIKGVNLY